METVTTSLIKKNNSFKFTISFLVFLILISVGFFIARALMGGENIAETETSASDVEDKVNYELGEILIGFKSDPQMDVTSQLQKATTLSDLKLKRKINSNLHLYESATLRNYSIVNLSSTNYTPVVSRWGNLDDGMERILSQIESNAPTQVTQFEYVEPNYKIQTFSR
jgi:hypothetical protein